MSRSRPSWVKIAEVGAIVLSISLAPMYLLSGQTYQPDAVVSVVANVELISLIKAGQYLIMTDAPGGYCFALQPGETPFRIHSVTPELVTIDSFKKNTSWSENLEGTIQTAHIERIIIPTRSVVKVTMPAALVPKAQ